MVDTYYLKEDNTAIINYAYKQGDVVVYPDLIKVKIALDNGEVIGLRARVIFPITRKEIFRLQNLLWRRPVPKFHRGCRF